MPTVTGIMPIGNGLLAHYPFLECAITALPLVDNLIIADGASTDGTWEALERLAAAYPTVRLVVTPHERCGHWETIDRSLEAMIAIAQGEWIYEVQADEFIAVGDRPAMRQALAQAHYGGFASLRQPSCGATWTTMSGPHAESYRHVRWFRNQPWIASRWGGDCFHLTGQPERPAQPALGRAEPYTTHNLQPEMEIGIANWNFCYAVARAAVAKYERQLAHYDDDTLGARGLVLEKMRARGIRPVTHASPEALAIIPPIFHGLLGRTDYVVRDEVFDADRWR